MTTVITYEQFEEKYKPVLNHLDENANHDGVIYETYGKEVEYIKSIYENGNKLTIWTYIDDGEISWYESGYHLCDRQGYIITEIPFNEGENIIVCDEYDVEHFDGYCLDEDDVENIDENCNAVRASYEGGVCPDCNTEIPLDVVDGQECSICGHVFTITKECD